MPSWPFNFDFISINTLCGHAVDISPEAVKNLTQFNKPYIISLSGLSLADNIPNKPIIAYDFEQMDLVSTSHPRYHTKPLGIKLAPYFDKSHYERVVSIIAQYQYYLEVTTNTMGNGSALTTTSADIIIYGSDTSLA